MLLAALVPSANAFSLPRISTAPATHFTKLSQATRIQADPSKGDNSVGSGAPPPGFLRKTFPRIPWRRVPNWLTYLRCMAIPALVFLFYTPYAEKATSLLFAGASITDWLDGYLARRWDIASPFGAFLDPVADKLMVSTALILLSGRYGPSLVLPTAIILAREIAVSALREWCAQRGQRDTVQVGYQGKVKTALTMVSITLLLLVPGHGRMVPMINLYLPGTLLLYISTFITVTSGWMYFEAAAPLLLEKEEDEEES